MEQVFERDVTELKEEKQRKADRKDSRRTLWWKKYYVYVISSLLILLAITVVLAVKKFWPFGNGVLLNGDFILQGWPFILEFKRKLASGESLLYTWNAAFGTNFFSILTYGLVNPSTLVFMLVPEQYILQTSTILYVMNMLLINGSMLYFLTHRPGHHLEGNRIANMLFSLSYTLCFYMVSNINNWTFLIVAALFPLIILGLEQFVANQDWKLYFVTLALSFLFNYYFTGLFCVFIILYYLTLEFGSFRNFWRKSVKITLISILAILISGVALLPTAMQMMGQSYTKSDMLPGIFFTTVFDEFKNFLAFNCDIGRGSASDSYGEVNLYYGLLLLLLTSFYFLNKKIKRKVRLKKLWVLLLYLAAFNTNALNYGMHLFHYPTWFPNRFSLFFTFFCILLAYDAWVSMEETDFKHMTVLRGVLLGLAWVIITVACFAFAKEIQYEFTYYYSIMIFLFYMVAMLLLPYLKGKGARVLAVIGCIELILNFDYAFIYRFSGQDISDFGTYAEKEQGLINTYLTEEANGFSRLLEANDIVGGVNGGMLLDVKSNSIFASSMNNSTSDFLWYFGILGGGNTLKSYTYTPMIMSMMNLQYILWDDNVADSRLPKELYSTSPNLFEQYVLLAKENGIALYENPTVLSLGYMVDSNAENFWDEAVNKDEYGGYCVENINAWVEAVSGISQVMEPVELTLNNIEMLNCEGAIVDSYFYLTQDLHQGDVENFYKNGSVVFVNNSMEEYQKGENSVLRLDCTATDEGDYFIEIGGEFAAVGYLERGENFYVYYSGSNELLDDNLGTSGKIQLYRVDAEQWRKAYNVLAEQQLQVTSYNSSEMKGTIEVTKAGLMFTSIPYDKNWTLYVDGEIAEIVPLWEDAFVGVNLPEGTHVIYLKYYPKGLWQGCVLSLTAIVLAGVLMFRDRKKSGYNEENEEL
ncbi:MAG: YfhO family protein [Bacteroides sp.]|nr:YfhO family protein [Bacteroides sp.]MCM1548623.1 YfhO family protein [Clostridium sp.]